MKRTKVCLNYGDSPAVFVYLPVNFRMYIGKRHVQRMFRALSKMNAPVNVYDRNGILRLEFVIGR